jgi:hypothetical protein
MAQQLTRWLLYLALATGLIACACALAFLLLCGLTPSVTVFNHSQWTIDQISIALPSNQLTLDAIAPGQEARVFYDANQADGVYRINLHRNGEPTGTECGYVTHGEWGKRLQIHVDDHTIECREQLHY